MVDKSGGFDPITYSVAPHDRPEVFEKHLPHRHDVVRGLAAFGAIVLALWFVTTLALWAVGFTWTIIISGVAGLLIAAILGLGLSLGSPS